MTRSWIRNLFLLLLLGIVAQAIIEQLREDKADRTWQGKVAGVPYDFRPPTPARIKKAFWAPEEAFVTPHSPGVGWSVNLGRIVYEVKKHAPGGDSSAGEV
ncbi:MAG: hypothetical protein QOF82_2273 [Frankiales bacterium]|jgi:hypothetical protein|nr:hypothetical protein [Frankiales bacterium]MDX6209588.1 hypothetical protein [Frankiales bacterium]MDX6213186.1 hypothetical protein [Frankiales bacterium]